jgi:hypothetical protein
MNAYALFEFSVIGGALLLSLWTVLGKLAPHSRATLVARLRGKPAPKASAAGGCGSCNSCGDCETPRPAAKAEQPIRFHRP